LCICACVCVTRKGQESDEKQSAENAIKCVHTADLDVLGVICIKCDRAVAGLCTEHHDFQHWECQQISKRRIEIDWSLV
jgi:hypothetical protein